MYYLNNSYATRVFQGVTFKPGEVAEVKDWINDPSMIRVPKPEVVEPAAVTKPAQKSTSTATKSSTRTTKSTAAKKSADTATPTNKEEITDGKDSDK